MNNRLYTLEEVKKHRKKGDCWAILDGWILDISKYTEKHPGSESIIIENAGTDISYIFDKICHSNEAYELTMKYRIGKLIKADK